MMDGTARSMTGWDRDVDVLGALDIFWTNAFINNFSGKPEFEPSMVTYSLCLGRHHLVC